MTSSEKPLSVVTGACGPLGRSIVSTLHEAGHAVIATDVPMAVESESTHFEMPNLDLFPLDLLEPNASDRLVEFVYSRTSRVDLLVNNAGLTGTSSVQGYACGFEEQSDEAYDLALHLNLAIPFRLTRRLLPVLRAPGSASVINISSIYGLVGPDPTLYEGSDIGNPAAYAASKGGLIQLTRYLATMLAPEIRVNCVAPGGIFRNQDSEFVARYVERTPLGRMASEKDVAATILWLSSPDSSYVTGQTIAVDGGWTAR